VDLKTSETIMKHLLLLALFVLLGFCKANCQAQTPDWVWARSAHTSQGAEGNSVCSDKYDNVFIAGSYNSKISFGTDTLPGSFLSKDAFIAKYDSNGNVIWAKSVGGLWADIATGVSTDINGDIYITGYFESDSLVFGGLTIKKQLGNASYNGILVAKYSTNGTILWAKYSDNYHADSYCYAISINNSGDAYVTGGYFSLAIPPFYLNAVGNNDVFVAKLASTVSTKEFLHENDFLKIYPNPLTSSSTLQFNTQLKNAAVVIYDMVGKEMMRKKFTGDRIEIEKGSLASGVYFVKVASEEKQYVQKIVVE